MRRSSLPYTCMRIGRVVSMARDERSSSSDSRHLRFRDCERQLGSSRRGVLPRSWQTAASDPAGRRDAGAAGSAAGGASAGSARSRSFRRDRDRPGARRARRRGGAARQGGARGWASAERACRPSGAEKARHRCAQGARAFPPDALAARPEPAGPGRAARRARSTASGRVIDRRRRPGGLFCAYELARHGIGCVVLDRGKPVQPRRRDLKGLTQHGARRPDSNYCFGEGGAGTYSDGKLYTRSHKRGDVRDVLEMLAVHGAPDRHPGRRAAAHRLEQAAQGDHGDARATSSELGVAFRFGARVTGIRAQARRARALGDARRRQRARRRGAWCSRPATRRATSTSCSTTRACGSRPRPSRWACASSTRSR